MRFHKMPEKKNITSRKLNVSRDTMFHKQKTVFLGSVLHAVSKEVPQTKVQFLMIGLLKGKGAN